MKVAHKVGSLFRRRVAFFAMTYCWETKALAILHTYQEYK